MRESPRRASRFTGSAQPTWRLAARREFEERRHCDADRIRGAQRIGDEKLSVERETAESVFRNPFSIAEMVERRAATRLQRGVIPTAALTTGASICLLLSPRQYPVQARPTHPPATPSMHRRATTRNRRPSLQTRLERWSTLSPSPAMRGRSGMRAKKMTLELGVEFFDDLSFVFPGAVSLRPCAMAGPAAHSTPNTNATDNLSCGHGCVADRYWRRLPLSSLPFGFSSATAFPALRRRRALERLNRLPERHRRVARCPDRAGRHAGHPRLEIRERNIQVVRDVHCGNELTPVLESLRRVLNVRAGRQQRQKPRLELRVLH